MSAYHLLSLLPANGHCNNCLSACWPANRLCLIVEFCDCFFFRVSYVPYCRIIHSVSCESSACLSLGFIVHHNMYYSKSYNSDAHLNIGWNQYYLMSGLNRGEKNLFYLPVCCLLFSLAFPDFSGSVFLVS